MQVQTKDKFADTGSERMVLSCVLNVPDLLIDVKTRLSERDFLSDNHRSLYAVLCALYASGVKSFDIMAIVSESTDKGMLDLIGGAEYVDALMYNPVNPENLEVYLLKVLECSTKYRLFRRTEVIQENILANVGSSEDTEPADILIAKAESGILEVSMEAKQVEDAVNLSDNLAEILKKKQENPVDVMGLSTNIELLDKAINGLTPGSLSIFAARAKGGKCLSGDSLVLDTSTGVYRAISEFHGRSATLEQGRFNSCKVFGPISNGVKVVYEVVTRTGLKLKVTDNHPFMHASGWADIKSGHIVTGEHVAVAANLPFFGDIGMPEEHIKLLAYWLAEGTRGGRHISATNPDVIEDFTSAMASIGGECELVAQSVRTRNTQQSKDSFISELNLTSKIDAYTIKHNTSRRALSASAGIAPPTLHYMYHGGRAQKSSLEKLTAVDPDIFEFKNPSLRRLSGNLIKNPLQHMLEEKGVDVTSYSYEKIIPECIFTLSKQNIALFLNRLYSGDGWVTRTEIGYSTSSEEMAYQVKALLLRFGIVAHKRLKVTACRDNFIITIRKSRWMRTFIENIGCLGRQREIDNVYDSLQLCRNSDVYGNPPKQLQEELVEEIRASPYSFADIAKQTSYCVSTRRNASTGNFNKVASFIGCTKLSELSTPDLYWDEIMSVTPLGEEEVFDIQILDGKPNFVANGFVVHNSTLMLNMAAHIAFTLGVPVLFIDTELSTEEVQMRTVSHLSQVPERLITNGKYIENESLTSNVWRAHAVMERGQLFHKYMPGFSMDAVKSMVRKYHAREGIGVFFFDYIKLPEVSGNDSFKEHQILGNIATGLKDLAGQLRIPVVAAAQIKRGDSSHPKTRFHDSDVADSDRLGRYCSNLCAIGQKTKKEIEEDGLTCGTHRLQVLLARSGTPNYYGIDLSCNLPTLTMTQAEHQAYQLATAEQFK